MNSFISFLKKEFLEMFRSYKILILACVFFLLGVMNPITAKYTPELLKSFKTEGVSITVSDPTAMDSWMQFFKNVNLMGIAIIVIVFSSILSSEINKGTLINIVTKGFKRRNVLFSKLTAVIIMWTVCFFFSFIISYVYTKFFFNESVKYLIFSVFIVWLFGIFMISALIFGSLLSKSNFSSLLFVVVIIAMLYILNIIPKVSNYNPIMLVTSNMDLLKGVKDTSDFLKPIIVNIAASFILIISSIKIFNKKMI